MTLAGLGPWLAVGLVLVVAVAAGRLPRRLMREACAGGWTSRDERMLMAAGLLAGLLVLVVAEAAPSGPGGPDWRTAAALAICGVMLAGVMLTDVRAMVVADLHVVALLVLAVVGPLASSPERLAAGVVVGGGLLWAVRWLFQRARGVEGLGLGDVKLMAAMGALVGPEAVLWIIVGGALIGLAWALTPGRGRREGRIAVPFGAAAAPPALAVLMFQQGLGQ